MKPVRNYPFEIITAGRLYPDPLARTPAAENRSTSTPHLTQRLHELRDELQTVEATAGLEARETFVNVVPDALHHAEREQRKEKRDGAD